RPPVKPPRERRGDFSPAFQRRGRRERDNVSRQRRTNRASVIQSSLPRRPFISGVHFPTLKRRAKIKRRVAAVALVHTSSYFMRWRRASIFAPVATALAQANAAPVPLRAGAHSAWR